MKKFKAFIILGLLLLIYTFVCAYSYVCAISDNLYSNVLRLHIIANSDKKEDQELKYIVRDNLLQYMNEKSKYFTNKDEVISYSKEHILELKKVAEETILKCGFNYPVEIDIGNFEFPTKNYGDISFPSGYYDAIRVKIGNASGQNWWCVMFPPLCFINTTSSVVPNSSKELLKSELSDENYRIIADNKSTDIALKFKIIEFFENTGLFTAKK